MTDIVERLRKPTVNGLWHPVDDERKEAADEIEQLRAELKRWQDMNGKILDQNYRFTQLLVEQDTVIKQLRRTNGKSDNEIPA